MPQTDTDLPLFDYAPQPGDLVGEVCAALRHQPRQLPAKFFYDERGSALFDQICELDEYYLTRAEMSIMRRHGRDIARCIGQGAMIVEFGAGSLLKTRLLLDALSDPAGYVPLDISRAHLIQAARALAEQYPGLEVLPVCADYHQPFEIPPPSQPPKRTVAYFPGSTIGNLHPEAARRFLKRIAQIVGPGGGLLIGVDLKKDPNILIPAYSDAKGVTAAFNYNLLNRINREAPADFNVSQFHHEARWNDRCSRMESHLVSQCAQCVTVAGASFDFAAGDSIWTECSYKYTLEGFASLAEDFHVQHIWHDEAKYFTVQYLTV
jgi:dimethylhistidine N-methyltransferase